MIDQNLVSFIQESLKRGSSKDEIEKSLLAKGWLPAQIAQGFAIVTGQEPEDPSKEFTFAKRFKINTQSLRTGPGRSFILRVIESSFVASITGVAIVYVVLFGDIFIGTGGFEGYGLAILFLFGTPIVITIVYFLLYRLMWRFLSKNSIADPDQEFQWWHAIVSFIIVVAIASGVIYIINERRVSREITALHQQWDAKEKKEQTLIDQKLAAQQAELFPAQSLSAEPSGAITYEGETYPIVTIGKQTWFARSLNLGPDSPYECSFGTDCIKEYNLYTWADATKSLPDQPPTASGLVQGICPAGWHIPSHEDFLALEVALQPTCGSERPTYLSYKVQFSCTGVGDMLKTAKGCFTQKNCNSSLFSMKLSEIEKRYGLEETMVLDTQGNEGFLWSATTDPDNKEAAIARIFSSHEGGVGIITNPKSDSLQVRCLKN